MGPEKLQGHRARRGREGAGRQGRRSGSKMPNAGGQPHCVSLARTARVILKTFALLVSCAETCCKEEPERDLGDFTSQRARSQIRQARALSSWLPGREKIRLRSFDWQEAHGT